MRVAALQIVRVPQPPPLHHRLLTARSVLKRVVEDFPDNLIAHQFDISVRTLEAHRARVFDKMDVKSAVERVNSLRNL